MAKYKLVGTAFFSVFAVIGVREYLKPRDIQSLLKWNGVKLISSKEGWNSAFFENKDNLKALGIEDADGLWKWCAERFSYGTADSSIVSSVKKYCQDNPKTVMGHIIRAGEEGKLLKKDDKVAREIIYLTANDKDRLIKTLNIEIISNDNNKSGSSYIGKKILEWCDSETKKNVRDKEHLGNVKRYCYDKGVRNVKQLLDKEGLKTLGNTDDYKKRFNETLRNSPELISQMKHILKNKREEKLKALEFYKYSEEQKQAEKEKIENMLPEDSKLNEKFIKDNKNYGGQYFKWYCESNYNENLNGTGVFPEIYQRIKSRCTIK